MNEPTAADLDKEIAGLEHYIASLREALPYVDKGYYEEQRRLHEHELKLQALQQLRAACD